MYLSISLHPGWLSALWTLLTLPLQPTISQVADGKTDSEKYSNPQTTPYQVQMEAVSDCKAYFKTCPCHMASTVVSTLQPIQHSHIHSQE